MRTLKFLALSMLTLSVGLAQDHPIIISGGSPLTLEHDSWKLINDQHLGSNVSVKVTRVVIKSAASPKPTPIPFAGDMLKLDLDYGGKHVNVTTDNQGQDPVLTVEGSLQNDFNQVGNQFVSKNASSTISGVTVQKGSATPTPVTVNGHTKITICYGTPTSASVPECQ